MSYTQNYYTILGLSPGASDDEIRSAYRDIARNFHPDINRAPGAVALFKEVNEAYEVLSSPKKKEHFDHTTLKTMTATPAIEVIPYLSRTQVAKKVEDQIVYSFIKIKPLVKTSRKQSSPLNLSLVIDASTSMNGPRMQNVKNAARRIVDGCKTSDILSIVIFNDFSHIIVPASQIRDPLKIKSQISTIQAGGATAMLGGLQAGIQQIERNRDARNINHLILITDGRTFGDADECIQLAESAHTKGIRISCMGIGDDWNDRFLDTLATTTGGSSAYISKPESVDSFLRNAIQSLSTAFAERVQITISPTNNADLIDITRVSPDAMQLPTEPQPIPLGAVNDASALSLMLQFRVNTASNDYGPAFLCRVDICGDILGTGSYMERVVNKLIVDVNANPTHEDPPPELIDALSGLTLHKLQNRARDSLDQGNFDDATRQLKHLATRLFEQGHEDLAHSAQEEAEMIELKQTISEKGAKTLNYGTRALIEGD